MCLLLSTVEYTSRLSCTYCTLIIILDSSSLFCDILVHSFIQSPSSHPYVEKLFQLQENLGAKHKAGKIEIGYWNGAVFGPIQGLGK